MSAVAPSESVLVEPPATRWSGAAAGLPSTREERRFWLVPIGALLASRVVVVLAGVLGGLLPRDAGWARFDPARVSAGLGHVGNLLAASSVRWDALWYLRIAEHGYGTRASTAFFPLYPLLTRALSAMTGSTIAAALVISWVAFAVALILLHRLTELELGRRSADAAVLLLAFAPLSFFFSAIYTESLFLALTLGAAYAARRDRWASAGLLAALAAATRITGVLLVVLILLGTEWRSRRPRIPARHLWLLAAPAGLLAYLAGLSALGYSPLEPLTAQASGLHAHHFVGPLVAIARAVQAAARGVDALVHGAQPVISFGSLASPFAPGAESIYLLAVLALAMLGVIACLRRLPLAYGAFALLALLVAISSPVDGQPLKSLDRYTITIFPLWMVAGAWLARRRRRWPTLALAVSLLCFFVVQAAVWTFVA